MFNKTLQNIIRRNIQLYKKHQYYSTQNYNNHYFWLSYNKNNNIYDFGIKQNFIIDHGTIKKYSINNFLINRKPLTENTPIGSIITDLKKYDLYCPLEHCYLVKANNKLDIENLNYDPENNINSLATFEFKNDILRETYFRYFV